ncbi:Ca2+ regulator and membrane fusion protein Fig1-domain-containing protein [Hypoxylon fuscum]|nr:Ca2+ regulator and membrane fusion protein Fig1-domain-containing protein [Hypoxylon fuscum]
MLAQQKPRVFDRVDIRFVAYLLLSVIIVFYILTLTGCLSTSPGIPDLFLMKLETNQPASAQIRVGYYGMCASQKREGPVTCGQTYSLDLNQLSEKFLGDNETSADQQGDMVELLSIAKIIQTKIFYPLLAASAGLFGLSIVALLLLKRYIKSIVPNAEPKKKRLRLALSILRQYAFATALAAAFSTTQGTGALNFSTTVLAKSASHITITAGAPVHGLQWTIVALLVVMHYSVSALFSPASGGGGPPNFFPQPGGLPPPMRASPWRKAKGEVLPPSNPFNYPVTTKRLGDPKVTPDPALFVVGDSEDSSSEGEIRTPEAAKVPEFTPLKSPPDT